MCERISTAVQRVELPVTAEGSTSVTSAVDLTDSLRLPGTLPLTGMLNMVIAYDATITRDISGAIHERQTK